MIRSVYIGRERENNKKLHIIRKGRHFYNVIIIKFHAAIRPHEEILHTIQNFYQNKSVCEFDFLGAQMKYSNVSLLLYPVAVLAGRQGPHLHRPNRFSFEEFQSRITSTGLQARVSLENGVVWGMSRHT